MSDTYSGTLSYEDEESGELEVRRFVRVGDDMIVFELVTPEYTDDEEDARILGVAEEDEDGGFTSPWIYLTQEDGEEFEDEESADYAAVTFTVVNENGDELEVEGVWYDSDEEEYAFSGTLTRD